MTVSTSGKRTGYWRTSALAAAKTARAPPRITETSSACAGGVKGAGNAYASAL